MSLQLHPQEVEVFYILPAIRREFSIALKAQGKSQKEIAKLLGVTEAAVSQYIKLKRASVALPKEMQQHVIAAAARINDQQTMLRETQALLRIAKEHKFLCKLHEQVAGDIPKGCDVCFKVRP